jgi:hypothetical protein
MFTLPPVHLCILQPGSYVHSLGFLDPARYYRHQFQRMGAEVTLAKNRLHSNAINFIFGAHLGFDPQLKQRYHCIFVNLEQLGAGGAQLSADYLQLLSNSAVVDYDAANLNAYTRHHEDVPLLPLLYAPYLSTLEPQPLEERPIDLLFIGSMNARRKQWLERIEALGWKVSQFDSPLYGPERDHFIKQSKAVLNTHFYATSRFEQTRVSHCLSLGTPVISERGPATEPHAAFEESVFWVNEQNLEEFFSQTFAQPPYFEQSRKTLQQFSKSDPVEAYADALAFAAGFFEEQNKRRPPQVWQPQRINLGSGKDYKLGWLNLDILERAQPDLVLNLGEPLQWPIDMQSAQAGRVLIEPHSVSHLYANNVLEHVPDLPMLMTNCLDMLQVNGEFQIEVPYEHAPTAWQDPTHLRALNENSWVYYTDWFWYLGWFEYRFQLARFNYLDLQLKECTKESAAFMRVTLVKIATTMQERMTARVMRPDFALPDD